MGSSSKQPTISIPTFQKPDPAVYKAFGWTTEPNGNGFSLTGSPTDQAEYNMAQGIRSELIKALGLSGPSGGAKEYGDLLTKETLRTAQPTLENALIGRGLGGSSVYKDALTDLITKVSTQGTLAAGDYVRQNLASIGSGYFNPIYSLGQNLLQLATSKSSNDQQLAQQLYLATLPYLATVNIPGNNGIEGLINGGLTGAQYGGLPGAVAGGTLGYFDSKSNPTSQSLYLYNLAQQNQQNNNTLNALKSLYGGSGRSNSSSFLDVFGKAS